MDKPTPEEYLRQEINKDLQKARENIMSMQEGARELATADAEHISEVDLANAAAAAKNLSENTTYMLLSVVVLNTLAHDKEEAT